MDQPKRPFFVLGAPTEDMMDKVTQFKPDAIFVNASYETFVKSSNTSPCNVYKLPTNFRAHADDANKVQGGVHIKNVGSFKTAQMKVSNAVNKLMRYKGCKVYFASIPRDERPFRIYVDSGKTVIHDNPNKNKTVKVEIEKKTLNETLNEFFKKIVLPVFGKKSETVREQNKNLTKKILKHSPQHKASYVVDTLTAICARLATNKDLWDQFNVTTSVQTDGIYPYSSDYNQNDIFYAPEQREPEQGVSYCKVDTSTTRQTRNIWSYKTDETTIEKIVDEVTKLIDSADTSENKWTESFVWHDTYLNDIDDPVAIELIRTFTTGTVNTRCNYVDSYLDGIVGLNDNIKKKLMDKLSIDALMDAAGNEVDRKLNGEDFGETYNEAWWVDCMSCTAIKNSLKNEMDSTAYILRCLNMSMKACNTESVLEVEWSTEDLTGKWNIDKKHLEIVNFRDRQKGQLIMGFGPSASGKTFWARNVIKILNEIYSEQKLAIKKQSSNPSPPSQNTRSKVDENRQRRTALTSSTYGSRTTIIGIGGVKTTIADGVDPDYISIDGGVYREASRVYQTVVERVQRNNFGGFKNLVPSQGEKLFDSDVVKDAIYEYLNGKVESGESGRPNLYVPETLGGCVGPFSSKGLCRNVYKRYITLCDDENWVGLCIWQHKDDTRCTFGPQYKCVGCTESGLARQRSEGKIYSNSRWEASYTRGQEHAKLSKRWLIIHNTGGRKYIDARTGDEQFCTSLIETILEGEELRTLKRLQKQYNFEVYRHLNIIGSIKL